jgi:oxaloacetate decarboxylase gamma subunit
MAGTLLEQGFTLMLVGMGTVFVFLTALVIAMTLMSRLVCRFQPLPPPVGGPDDEIAAISAAIAAHRREQR